MAITPIRVDALRELVESGSAPWKQTKRSYVLYCPDPACGRPKLYIEKQTGRCKCFRCGLGGMPDYVLSRVYPMSREELRALLYGGLVDDAESADEILAGTWFWWDEDPEVDEDAEPVDPHPPEMMADPDWVPLRSTQGMPGRAYLERRGVPLEVAEAHGVVFNPAMQRVVFPIVVGGKLRGYQGRYIGPTEGLREDGTTWKVPKVKTEGKVGGKCFIFQDSLEKAQYGEWAILVEGPLDAIKCYGTGMPAVASMGKDIPQGLLDILAASGVKNVLVGLDWDAEVEAGGVANYLVHQKGLKCYRLLPPSHRDDLGDCTMPEVIEAVRGASPMLGC